MTETREPQPYHPPKAYEPPAQRSASDTPSGSGSGSGSASGSGKASAPESADGAEGAEGGKGLNGGKAAETAKEDKAAKAATAAKAEKSEKSEKADKAAKAVQAARNEAAKDAKGLKAAKAAEGTEEPKGGKAARTAVRPAGEDPARAASPAARTAPRTRKARLRVSRADPWSVMKVSFLLSVALGVCTIVAAAVLWGVMDAMGVFSAVGGTISDATTASGESGGGFDLESFLSLPHVLLFTTVIAVIDVVLATALATLGAFVYNLAAGFVGGVELTLAEDE
ncbi:DUF3566 domain-containing protein [Streptomyces sp. SCA3-4]|uniref:DUF3566 domain-containing protein n=1 Tax=Streptomyces sichuanensis TaxID=2871810 RepID=UPI001CE2EFA1|nr:DUF3566 domain-containing protein [Streptomyces sichuanensis]MCA6093928.1 DUF3566 domain-containing protein [Streptomyces sichuanensis]